MGNSSSVPQPPPKKLTDIPWREPANFGKDLEKNLLNDIRNISSSVKGKPSLVMIGPVGAGKSSFINSVLSICKGRKVMIAQPGLCTSSFTREYEAFPENSILKGFRLRDTMGIEPNFDAGFHVEDFDYLVKGHIKNNYVFDPSGPITITSPFYRRHPRLEDQAHCVVFVVSAKHLDSYFAADHENKFKQLMAKLRKTKIPRVFVLTKADELCDEVKKDSGLMFRSVAIQRAVKKASQTFGTEMASIHPVVNYVDAFNLTAEQNCPLLLAIRQMAQYASDRMEHVKEGKNI